MRTLVPRDCERWEVRRARELREDLRLYDAGLASLLADIGEERRRCGLGASVEMPTSLQSPRMRALMAGLTQLSAWHSAALNEHSALV